ncbi:MAG: alpha/beta hydrolase [Myxococcota bacterium]
MRFIFRILILAPVLYIILVVFVYYYQNNLLYYPESGIAATPENYGLDWENIYFETADHIKLNGWFLPGKNSEEVILLSHGNAGNISNRLPLLRLLNTLGINIFIYDYRGYGRNEGSPGEAGLYLDIEAAFSYLQETKNFKPKQIILMGRSLGGGVTGHLAARERVKGVILESTFTSVPNLAADLYWFLPVRQLCKNNFATINKVARIKSPLLIIHSREDELIPFEHGQKLFEKATEPKSFLAITGSHNQGSLNSKKEYITALKSFIQNPLNNSQ